MSHPRIYSDQPLTVGDEITLEQRPSHHLAQVLRLKPGVEVTLFNGDGHDYPSQLQATGKRAVVARITDRGEPEPLPLLPIELGIGISKGERMDFAVQKAVELGVATITPLITQRCVVRLSAERMEKRLAHWRNTLISACEQSGRRRLPELRPSCRLEEWLEKGQQLGILLDHRASHRLQELPPPQPGESVRLLIGPEGGLTDEERIVAANAGFRGVRLGPRVLRTETAPLAAIAAIQTLWGDFR